MTTIKAKVIDGFHLGLEKGIPTKTGDEAGIQKIIHNGSIVLDFRRISTESARSTSYKP